MSDQLPYEELLKQQLNELSLPDEEQSWQKMKQLLEDDDDRVPTPVLLRSCAGWGLLLLLLVVVGWLVFRPGGWWKRNSSTALIQKTTNSAREKEDGQPYKLQESIEENARSTQLPARIDSLVQNEKTRARGTKELTETPTPNKERKSIPETGKMYVPKGGAIILSKKKKEVVKNKRVANHPNRRAVATTNFKGDIETKNVSEASTTEPSKMDHPLKDTNTLVQRPVSDTVAGRQKSSGVQKGEEKKDTSVMGPQKNKSFYFGAGIGVQQQIPLAGQKVTPYNYYGRRGSLADYIPSVFVRLYRDQKWFVHAEFRYGAPQATKEFSYSTASQTDSLGAQGSVTTTTSLSLKKTFYHQVPLSFNYFIRPGWSLGTGVLYSRFYSAVAEKDLNRKNNQTQVQTTTKSIIQVPSSTDSFFTKSQLHVLVQSEYQWRRLGVGLRYTQGLQPFIRYVQNGVMKEEKNHSLQFFIRYQLWQSRKN